MSGFGSPVRRCPDCGEEFQPHVVHCSDCGALLESAVEREVVPDGGGTLPGGAPSPDYVGLVSGLTSEMAEQAAQHLGAAGIPFRVISDYRRGLRLGVERARMQEAVAILERAGVVPAQPDPAEVAVAAEGGPCPACGDHVAPGTVECPGCGLQVGGAFQCRHCGGDLDPALDACPECAREQD